MSLTLGTNNYNGEVIKYITKVLSVGNQFVNKGMARIETGIRYKKAIPRLSATVNPIGDYETTPSADTVTTSYAERELVVKKGMIRETMDPVTWQNIWDEYASQGTTMTNLTMNPTIMQAVIDLYKDGAGTQLSGEFWNASIGGGDRIDGIITKAAADANVIDVTNIGVITQSNVFDVIQDVWDAIPNHLIDDPNFKICMSTTNWRMAQAADLAAKSSTVGYFDTPIGKLFLSNKLEHFSGIPANTIVGVKGTLSEDSNIIIGVYATPDDEIGAPKLGPLRSDSDAMVVRINFKYDINYAWGGEIVLYQGA